MKVVTAASGNYESTLKSEIAKSDAPTLFQINGPVGYQAWKDYCANLKDTKFYQELTDKELVITGEDGGVYGVPYNELLRYQFHSCKTDKFSSLPILPLLLFLPKTCLSPYSSFSQCKKQQAP